MRRHENDEEGEQPATPHFLQPATPQLPQLPHLQVRMTGEAATEYLPLQEGTPTPTSQALQPTTCRERVRDLFDAHPMRVAVVCVILISTAAVIAETVPDLGKVHAIFLSDLEFVVTFLFTLEIMVRIWIAEQPCVYFVSVGNLVDVLAVLPWYFEFAATQVISAARTQLSAELADAFQLMRLMRIVRVAKAARHSQIITTVLESILGSMQGLTALLAFVFMTTILSATLVFFLECEEPDTPFTSIPAAVWWALPTVTGVGYGDMVPTTVPGKLAGSCTMVVGVLITSLSVAITTQSFVEHFHRNMHRVKVEKKRSAMKRFSSNNLSGMLGAPADSPQSGTGMGLGAPDALISRLPDIEMELESLLSELQGSVIASGAYAFWGNSNREVHQGLLTSVELLQEQSKMWFRQAARVSKEVLNLEASLHYQRCGDPRTPTPPPSVHGGQPSVRGRGDSLATTSSASPSVNGGARWRGDSLTSME